MRLWGDYSFGLLAATCGLSCVLYGCGGGGGVTSIAPAGTQTMQAGPLSVSFPAGQNPAVLTQSNFETVVEGLAGAAFTNVTLTPSPSAANTMIAYDSQGLTYSITPSGLSNTLLSTIIPFFSNSSFPAWSTDGHICVSSTDLNSNKLIVMSADGSNPRTIYSGRAVISAAWQPRSQKIVFSIFDTDNFYQIYTIQSNGTGLVKLSDGTAHDLYPAFSADGTKIAFSRFDGTGHYQVYIGNSNLGSVQSLASLNTGASFSGNDCLYPAFSPDGNSVIFSYGGTTIWRASLVGQGARVLVQNNNGVSKACFSPDGRSLVYAALGANSSSIVVSQADGSNSNAIATAPFGLNAPSWSPYPSSLNYIGNTGIFGNASSGFLIGQVGPAVTSVLSFAATTPTSATVTGTSNAGAADLVFTLSADSIVKLQYMNHLYTVPVSVIPVTGTTSAHQALITVDGTSGTIDLVVPVAGKARGSHLLPAARHGDNLTYTGQFLAIYDKDGKNLAKLGASSITVNGKTGRLVQFS